MGLIFFKNGNTVDILAKQGEHWEINLNLKDKDNNPIDLTGYNIKGQIRKKYNDPNIIAEFNCDIVDPPNGIIRIYLPPDITSNIPAFFTSVDNLNITSMLEGITGVYVYDIKIYKPDNTKAMRILEGKIVVDPQVSK